MLKTTTFRRSLNPSGGYSMEVWEDGELIITEQITKDDFIDRSGNLAVQGWYKTVEGRKIVYMFED